MEPFQILIQTGLEFLDGHLICAAGPSIVNRPGVPTPIGELS
jgi:hypothetical protein